MPSVTVASVLIVWLAAILWAVPEAADVPRKVNCQVMLTYEDSEPLPGSHGFIFRIFPAATDGTELWSE